MPWYIAFAISVLVIIAGIYKKLNIGLTMLLGAAALGVLSRLSLEQYWQLISSSLLSSITIMLVISVLLLGVLGHVLKSTGALEAIIDHLQYLVSDLRLITAAMPMLIGMLTVPGGAILSAPFCTEAGGKLKISAARQSAINIWFRHALYFMLPLFPSLIVASQLSTVSLGRFALHNLPLTIIGFIVGFYFLFKGHHARKQKTAITVMRIWQFFISISPLLLIFMLVVFLDLYFPLALLAGILLALLNYLPPGKRTGTFFIRLKTLLLPGIKLPIALVIIGIMVYKEMLTATNVISSLTEAVLTTGIPVIFLAVVFPFLVGLLVGENAASIAILFPLFIPLVPAGEYTYSAYLAFVYVSSTAGHMISPAHPCFSLTNEYCGTDMKKVVVLLLPLLILVLIIAFFITLAYGYY